MKSLHVLILAAALALPISACGGGDEAAESTPAATKPAESKPAKPAEMKAPGAEAKPAVADATPDPLIEARKSYHPALLDPSKATEQAPAKYTVKFETTKGDILIDVTREWSPNGADRFYNLVKIGYYDNDIAMFRVISGFMAQFGIHGDPAVNTVWRAAKIDDDPVKGSNTAGMVTFAMAGPNTRTTQIFMNLVDNKNLDAMKFSPFGKVQNMDVLGTIHSGYGEGAPRGRGPHQGMVQSKGNQYLQANFPDLDYIKKASIVE